MSIGLIILIAVLITAAFVLAAVVFDLPVPGLRSPGESKMQSQMKTVVSAQRDTTSRRNRDPDAPKVSVLESIAEEPEVKLASDGNLSLRKRLKYARWTKVTPLIFRLMSVGVSIIAFCLATLVFDVFLQVICLLFGPMLMGWLLNRAITKRIAAFDADYPQFLLSLVGLIKTGMNPMGAIEAAAVGLDDSSLVRAEAEMMLERLRLGVPEEKSIGSFGEDILHEEIELFVQALILSRRVGGNLSDTLERLARQVRRRQYFKKMAISAVGMQRGSIWFIIAVLAAMLIFLKFSFPEMIDAAFNDESSWTIMQGGIVVILVGMWWVRQVTKIKV